MTGDTYASLLAARQALNAGHTGQARQILLGVVKEDPDSFYGWLWLAGLVDSPRERLACLRRAEQIRPDDPALEKAWNWAGRGLAGTPGPAQDLTRPLPSDKDDGHGVVASRKVSSPSTSRGLLWRSLVVIGFLLLAAGTFVAAGLVWRSWHDGSLPAAAAAVDSVSAAAVAIPGAQQNPVRSPEGAATQGDSLLSAAEAPDKPLPTATQNPFRPKNIVFSLPGIPATWTPTPQPTSTPVPSPTPLPTFVGEVAASARPLGLRAGEHWIDVSLERQYLVAYEGLTPVFESKVSTGMARWPTVTGQFRIYLRFEAQDMDGYRLGYDYYLKNVPFVQYFFEDYALHGTYWHNRFGTPMSHGCVNLPTPAAEWLYRWADYGTVVNIHR